MSDGETILEALRAVEAERSRRTGEPGLAAAVTAVKRFQHARFERSYADLLQQPRYAAAARFFLDELYGPADFSDRDAQFARVVPGLTRLFSPEIVATVRDLAVLHALSESLDTTLAQALPPGQPLDAGRYVAAWQAVGRPDARERQIALMLQVGRALDRHTRSTLLRHSLRLMRRPAQAAGLGALQAFLESGFDTFRALGGAEDFLSIVATRERAVVAALFAVPPADLAAGAPRTGVLQQLP